MSYYLGAVVSVFLFFTVRPKGFQAAATSAVIFFLAVYGLLAPWQIRNDHRFGTPAFSHMESTMLQLDSLIGRYAKVKDTPDARVSPMSFYLDVSGRSLLKLYTDPGSLKYFKSWPLKAAGKVFGYLWVAFWLTGLIVGLWKTDKKLPRLFSVTVVLYFTILTIAAVGLTVTNRFRIPLVPFIAIISSSGWCAIMDRLKKKAP